MALALDGSNSSVGTANGTTTLTLTTTQSNDVIVAIIAANALGSSVTAPGLTFTQRSQANNSGSAWRVTTFYAIAASPLSNVTITLNWSNGNVLTSCWVFGVSGANTVTPWDTNGALPAISNSADNVTYSTTNANDFVITGMTEGNATPSPPSGFTAIAGPNTSYFSGVAYQIVTSTQSGVNVTWSQGGSGATMVDAIMQAGTVVIPLMGQQCM